MDDVMDLELYQSDEDDLAPIEYPLKFDHDAQKRDSAVGQDRFMEEMYDFGGPRSIIKTVEVDFFKQYLNDFGTDPIPDLLMWMSNDQENYEKYSSYLLPRLADVLLTDKDKIVTIDSAYANSSELPLPLVKPTSLIQPENDEISQGQLFLDIDGDFLQTNDNDILNTHAEEVIINDIEIIEEIMNITNGVARPDAEMPEVENEVQQNGLILDGYWVPQEIWGAACRKETTYEIAKLLFNYLFSPEEVQLCSRSGRNSNNPENLKLKQNKCLAIIRATSWIFEKNNSNLTSFDYLSDINQLLKVEDIQLLHSKLFVHHRHQRRLKILGKRRKCPLKSKPVSSIYPVPELCMDDAIDVEWAEKRFIPREVWAEAFIYILEENLTKAGITLFDKLFSIEEQIRCSIRGRRCNGVMVDILDQQRINAIIRELFLILPLILHIIFIPVICRWMEENKSSYPYSFPKLMNLQSQVILTDYELVNIKTKVFIEHRNQRKPRKPKARGTLNAE